MANRETYPASLFPLRGDVSAEAGATVVTVTGIQNIPVSAVPPTDTQTLVYVAADGQIEWAAAVGGSSDTLDVTQTLHGFTIGQAVYFDGALWHLAQSNSASTLSIGLVSAVAGPNDFTVMFAGIISGMSGLSAGNFYFVSDATPGALTTVEPVTVGNFSNPILFALTATTGVVEPYRPSVIATPPQSRTKVTSEWLDSYNASTGLFTQSQPADVDISFTDNTTGNVGITKHGFAPRAPNDSTQYLDGTGNYSVPSHSGSGSPPAATISTANDSFTAGQRRTYDLSMNKTFAAWLVTEATGKKFRLELYETSAQRLADAGRAVTQPLSLGQQHGCILDLYCEQILATTPFKLSPTIVGSNNDGSQATTIYAAVTSFETTTQNIQVTISFVAMES